MDGSLPSFEDRGAYIRSTHELEDQIIELAGHLNAANYRFLSLLAEFDRRKGRQCMSEQALTSMRRLQRRVGTAARWTTEWR